MQLKNSNVRFWPASAAVVLCLSAGSASAQDAADYLNQKVWFQIGYFHADIDSTVRAGFGGSAGTSIDLEGDLGLSKSKGLPTLLIGTRFADRWRAEFEYFQLSRSADQVISRQISFDDTNFPVSAAVSSDFRSKVYRASIGYSFYRTPQAEIGAVIGAHVTDFSFALEGQGSVGGATATLRRETQDRTIPLPTIGFYGTAAFAPNWLASARVDLLSLKVGDYDGSLVNVQANVAYRFTPNLAVGLGYRHDDYRLKVDRSDWQGRFNYRFSGPQVFVDAGF